MLKRLKLFFNLINPFNLGRDAADISETFSNIENRLTTIQNCIDEEIKTIKKDIDFYKNLLSVIVDTSQDMIWLKDLDGNYLFANTKIKRGLLFDCDPIGKNDIELSKAAKAKFGEHNHTFGEICGNSDKVIIQTMKPQRFLESGLIKGEPFYLEVFKAPFDVDGKFIGVVGNGRDMTEYVTAFRKNNCSGCNSMSDIFEKYEFKEVN